MFIVALCLNIIMLTVIFTDVSRFIIPNWLVGILLVFYPLTFFLSPVPMDILWPLGIAAIMFAVGFALFALKIMGGGDIKLLTVAALYVGKPVAIEFLMYVGIIGGVATLLLILIRPIAQWAIDVRSRATRLPRVLKKGEPVPYGVAIACAFLILLWNQQLPGITW